MSFADLKKIAEQTSVAQVSTRNNRNVPLLVTSYDPARQSVTGVDLFTNEDVTVKLRPDPKASERSHPRNEIADFAGMGRKAHASPAYTSVGGVIVFDYAYPDPAEPGVISARWGHPYSHFDGESDVFVAFAAPFVSRTNKFAMDVVRTLAAAPVNNVVELRERLADALEGPFSGAVIRATDGTDTVMYSRGHSDRVERIKVTNGKAALIPAEEAIDEFFKTPFGRTLENALGNSDDGYFHDFVVEVLPVERVYASAETQMQIGTKQNLERWHQMGAGVGYTQTILSVRHDDQGRMFLTARPMPVDTLPELYQLKNVPTQNIVPRVAPYVSTNLDHGNAPANDGISDELEAAIGINAPGSDEGRSISRSIANLR